MNVVVMASGRGSNARALFEAERDGRLGGAKIVGLISDNPEARALEEARSFGKPAVCVPPEKSGARYPAQASAKCAELIRQWGASLVVLAGFMKILPPEFVGSFPGKIINLHPSLLPAYKGKDAIKCAFEAGEKQCGCTVHFVNNELDGGEIIAQKVVEIEPGCTLEKLEEKVHEAEHALLVGVVAQIASGENAGK